MFNFVGLFLKIEFYFFFMFFLVVGFDVELLGFGLGIGVVEGFGLDGILGICFLFFDLLYFVEMIGKKIKFELSVINNFFFIKILIN